MAEQRFFLTSSAGDSAAATSDDNNLGVTLPLSPEVAGRLRQHLPVGELPHNKKEPPKLTFLSSKKPSSRPTNTDDKDLSVDENENESNENTAHGKLGISLLPDADPLDNWNEVMPLSPGMNPASGVVGDNDNVEGEEGGDGNNNDKTSSTDKSDKNNIDDDDDDDWSISPDPPPHLPVVVVNLKRLVGYIPKEQADKEQLEHQVHAALWYGSAEAANSKQGGNPQEDAEQVLDAAQHFDERLQELMQSGLATHSTTAEQTLAHQVVVSYPEFLCQPRDSYATDDNFAPRTVLATASAWKRLIKPHPIPVVSALLMHLQNCNRSLVWKYQMHKELVHLARTEKKSKIRRHQSQALREWKTVKREHQLEQLYQVRETLEHRLEMALSKVRELENVRDQAVALEIRRRRADNIGLGGLEALDLNSTILAFPEAQTWLGLEEEDDGYYDDQIGPSFLNASDDDDEDYYGGESDGGGSGYDGEGDAEEDDASGSETGTSTTINASQTEPAITSFPRRDNKARRAKVAKKRRRRLEEAAKEAEHQSKLDQARTEEAKVRDLCTTTDLKMAQAIRAALEKKMESVDELLESLQEEAWADEEAQENGEELVPGEEDEEGHQLDSTKTNEEIEFSLLDQVLAMVLGSFHPPENEDASELQEKHNQKIQAEHDKIVKEWKDYFGRLPPSLLSPEPEEVEENKTTIAKAGADRQTELRTAYGIEENEGDDWDADSDGGDDEEERHNKGMRDSTSEQVPPSIAAPPPAPKPQRVGLRPGGRARK